MPKFRIQKFRSHILKILFFVFLGGIGYLGLTWFGADMEDGTEFPVTAGEELGVLAYSPWSLEDILEDPESKKSFEPLKERMSISQGGDLLNLWVRLPLTNPESEKKDYILEVNYRWIDHVVFYAPDENGRYVAKERGERLHRFQSESSDELPYFQFSLAATESKVLYLKLQDPDWLNPSLTLWDDTKAFEASLRRQDRFIHLYIGLMFGIFVANVSAFMAFRHKDLSYYLLYLISSALLHLINFNFHFDSFYSLFGVSGFAESYFNIYIFGGLLVLNGGLLLLFSLEFLNLNKTAPGLSKFTRNFYFVQIAATPILMFGPAQLLGGAFTIVVAVWWSLSNVLALILGIRAASLGVRQALFYLSALVLSFVVAWRFNVILLMDELPREGILLQWIYASCLEMLIFAMGLLDRFFTINREKLESMKRYVDLQENYTDELSVTVQQRTESLHVANQQQERLLAYIAHDLRAPLNGLISLSSLLAKTPKNFRVDDIQDYAVEIEGGARGMSEVMENLLSWGKIQTRDQELTVQEYLVEDLFVATQRSVATQAKLRDVSILYEAGADFYVECDFTSIVMVLRNLISNAIKFAPPGSAISVSVRQKESGVQFSVDDAGPGLGEDLLNWMNELSPDSEPPPLEQQNQSGTGLGLRICHHILSLHGSRLMVSNLDEKGACFSFNLTLVES